MSQVEGRMENTWSSSNLKTKVSNQHVVLAHVCFWIILDFHFYSFRKKRTQNKNTYEGEKHMRWILNMWGKFE